MLGSVMTTLQFMGDGVQRIGPRLRAGISLESRPRQRGVSHGA